MELFAQRLREVRIKKNLSQQALADAANVSVRLYQYYESNKKCPSLENAAQIATALNVSLDYLCGLCDECETVK